MELLRERIACTAGALSDKTTNDIAEASPDKSMGKDASSDRSVPGTTPEQKMYYAHVWQNLALIILLTKLDMKWK
jgi:hypothetical protein